MADRIIVGKLSGSYGVKGEVRLKSFCETPEDIGNYTPLYLENGTELTQLVLTGRLKNGLSARLSNIVTKDDADALNGETLYANRETLPNLSEDEYYHTDLIGLDVYDAGGLCLGKVHNVADHGAGDLIELLPHMGSETVFIPFTRQNFPTVSLKAQKLIVDLPEGTL